MQLKYKRNLNNRNTWNQYWVKSVKKDDIQVDVLISANCIKALEPIKAIPSKAKGPYAYKTVSR